IADPLSDLPFGKFHCLFALAFSIFKFYNFGQSSTASRNRSMTRQLLQSIADLIFSFRAWHTVTLCEIIPIRRLLQWVRRSPDLLFFVLSAALFLFAHYCPCFVHKYKYLEIKDLHHPNCGLINTPNLNFCLSSSKTQFQQFKTDVSNSATQDSIMNAHKKTQLIHARINCALKDSSCDSPLSNILKFIILASNASSSSTKVLKCPHTKNDSIFTHNGSTI
ncbi:hypothetical protein H5410_003384, partial [Solanum commersonii]